MRIAAKEQLTVRELIIEVLREFTVGYPPPERELAPAGEELEVIWAPHRDAVSLLGSRPSAASL